MRCKMQACTKHTGIYLHPPTSDDCIQCNASSCLRVRTGLRAAASLTSDAISVKFIESFTRSISAWFWYEETLQKWGRTEGIKTQGRQVSRARTKAKATQRKPPALFTSVRTLAVRAPLGPGHRTPRPAGREKPKYAPRQNRAFRSK